MIKFSPGEEERKSYAKLFAPYMKEDSLHYCYRIERDEVADRTEQTGVDLADSHAGEKAYEHARPISPRPVTRRTGCS